MLVVILVIAALAGWRVWSLVRTVNDGIGRVDALTQPANLEDGETWLLAGSDSRDGTGEQALEGARSDTIMVVNKAPNGQASVISVPRDTYVTIPGHDPNKINAAYSLGGPSLLVETIEGLTGLTVDHYVEVGMGGIEQIVDAVGGVNLCLDYAFSDANTGLSWDPSVARCRDLGGHDALMFARMRYSDPRGDIGRAERQRQVVNAIMDKAISTDTLLSFSRQDRLAQAGAGALTVDTDTGVRDLVSLLRAYKAASAASLMGPPPIESLDYEPGGIGSAVLLRDTTAPEFFASVRAGTLQAHDFASLP